jgi:hypothetical protein
MALALMRIRREPPPTSTTTASALLGDLRGQMEVTRGLLAERKEYLRQVQRIDRVKALPGMRHARAAWRHERVQKTAGPMVLKTAKRVLRR